MQTVSAGSYLSLTPVQKSLQKVICLIQQSQQEARICGNSTETGSKHWRTSLYPVGTSSLQDETNIEALPSWPRYSNYKLIKIR